MDKNKTLGVISLVFAAFIWGFFGIFSRLVGIDFGIFYQAFSRSLILFLILSIILILKKNWKKVLLTDYKWFLGMSLMGLLSTVGSFIAFNYLSIGTTLFVFYAASTLGSYLLGFFLFQEKLTKIKVTSFLISLTGLFIVFFLTLERAKLFYVLLSILAGFGFAGWQIFSKKVSDRYSLIQVMMVDNINFIVISLLLVLGFKEKIILPSFSLLWLVVILYALLVLGACFLNIFGFWRLEAQKGSLIMLLEPFFGVIFGWLFYKEGLTIYSLIGGAMILFGAVLPNLVSDQPDLC